MNFSLYFINLAVTIFKSISDNIGEGENAI